MSAVTALLIFAVYCLSAVLLCAALVVMCEWRDRRYERREAARRRARIIASQRADGYRMHDGSAS